MRTVVICLALLFVGLAAVALSMGWLSGDVVHTDDLANEIERLEIVTDGQDGAAGLAGFNCWDLDMDRENDPFEDSNGDGTWDTADCRGAQGDQGPTGARGPRGPQGEKGDSGEPGVCPDCPTASATPPPVVTPAPTPSRPRIVIKRSVQVTAHRGRVQVEAPVTITGDGVEFTGDVTTNSRSATVEAPVIAR